MTLIYMGLPPPQGPHLIRIRLGQGLDRQNSGFPCQQAISYLLRSSIYSKEEVSNGAPHPTPSLSDELGP